MYLIVPDASLYDSSWFPSSPSSFLAFRDVWVREELALYRMLTLSETALQAYRDQGGSESGVRALENLVVAVMLMASSPHHFHVVNSVWILHPFSAHLAVSESERVAMERRRKEQKSKRTRRGDALVSPDCKEKGEEEEEEEWMSDVFQLKKKKRRSL